MQNSYTVEGFVNTLPRVTETMGNGEQRVSFIMGKTQRRKNKETGYWENGESIKIYVSCYIRDGRNALNCEKGDRCIATGAPNFSIDEWEGKRSVSISLRCNASDITFIHKPGNDGQREEGAGRVETSRFQSAPARKNESEGMFSEDEMAQPDFGTNFNEDILF